MNKNQTSKNKIFALMSGGVDSSVAAALLKKQKYNVTGIHLKISKFCDEKDKYDSRRVCEILNIPFYVIDISEEYQKTVALDTVKNYSLGYTPNPDVLCNKMIKFGYVFDKLNKLGFDYIATGHYARIIKNKIFAAKDLNKDQTYFLWGIKRNRIKKILFPIGDYLKKDVRQLAKKFGLPNSEKKDSQGICFLGKISLNDYLRQFLKEKTGEIVDFKGNVLGEHPGHWFFTEGQRHGLDIKTGKGPYFIAKKDPKKNLIIVAKANEKILETKQIKLKNLNWLTDISNNKIKVSARCRYRQPLVSATFDMDKNLLIFDQPQKAIAKGQSAVFYKQVKNTFLLLGGGIIR